MDLSNQRNKIINIAAKQLSDEGYKLIRKAFEESDYMHDKTQNLHDSYGCCCYYKGRKIQGTERYLTPLATEPRYNYYSKQDEYGKDEISKYFDSYNPDYDGLSLVIAVAMFYGKFLEEGAGRLKRTYRVISFVSNDVRDLASKFNARDKMIGKR